MAETILQSDFANQIIYPFLLVFVIVFAILEKSKILGEGKRQINAITALVVALVFVSFTKLTGVVVNLIPILILGVMVIFAFLLLWGFVASDKKEGLKLSKGIKIAAGIAIVLFLIIAIVIASGQWDYVYNSLFKESWTNDLWANIFLLAIVGGAIAVVLSTGKKDKEKDED